MTYDKMTWSRDKRLITFGPALSGTALTKKLDERNKEKEEGEAKRGGGFFFFFPFFGLTGWVRRETWAWLASTL